MINTKNLIAWFIIVIISIALTFTGLNTNTLLDKNKSINNDDIETILLDIIKKKNIKINNITKEKIKTALINNINFNIEIKNKIYINEEELLINILEISQFKENKRFSTTKYKNVVRKNYENESHFEKNVKKLLIENKIKECINISNIENKIKIKNINLYYLKINNKNNINIKNKNINNFYYKYNKKIFKKEYAKIKYIDISLKKISKFIEISKEKIKYFYKKNINKYKYQKLKKIDYINNKKKKSFWIIPEEINNTIEKQIFDKKICFSIKNNKSKIKIKKEKKIKILKRKIVNKDLTNSYIKKKSKKLINNKKKLKNSIKSDLKNISIKESNYFTKNNKKGIESLKKVKKYVFQNNNKSNKIIKINDNRYIIIKSIERKEKNIKKNKVLDYIKVYIKKIEEEKFLINKYKLLKNKNEELLKIYSNWNSKKNYNIFNNKDFPIKNRNNMHNKIYKNIKFIKNNNNYYIAILKIKDTNMNKFDNIEYNKYKIREN